MCAIRLLEHVIGTSDSIPLRGIYGTYKGDIDRAIRRHLGKVRIFVPEPVVAAVQAAKVPPCPSQPRPAPSKPRTPVRPASKGPVIELKANADGVYEVPDV